VVKAGGRQFVHQKDVSEGNAMKKTLLLSTATVLFSLIFFAGLCVAGGPVTKPIKTMWTGTAYVVGIGVIGDQCDGRVLVVNIATGVSTLTGQSQWFSEYCGDFSGESNENFSGEGWGIFTAANGDKGFATITITLNDKEFWQEETFIGGTGRFEGMTGDTTSAGTVIGDGEFPPFTSLTVYPHLLDAPSNWQATTTGSFTFNR